MSSDSGKPKPESGAESLSDRLKKNLSCGEGEDKPDKKLDPASPISTPTRTSSGFTATPTTTSCSSSSSGSVSSWASAKPNLKPARRSDSTPKTRSEKRSVKFTTPPSQSGGKSRARSGSSGSHSPRAPSSGSAPAQPASQSTPQPTPQPAGKRPILGNICPYYEYKPFINPNPGPRTKFLNPWNRNYGHGSVVRARASPKPTKESSVDPEEFRRSGDDNYKKGNFVEALSSYEKAIAISPANPAYRFGRSTALLGLKRFVDAAEACEETIRIDPKHVKAHHRLGSLLLRLGDVNNARNHLCLPEHKLDPMDLEKLQSMETHMNNITDFRRTGDWRNVLREIDAIVSYGADASPQIYACRAEALLKLHQLDDANSTISKISSTATTLSGSKIFGMVSESYISSVRAQIELARGKFDSAVMAIEKAALKDAHNAEISVLVNNVKMVSRARDHGNELFKIKKFSEACSSYAEGLGIDPFNPVLYCNRAACWYKLGLFERSVEDCNQALRIQPKYSKALLRRAGAYLKLERWNQAIYDYNVLIQELPDDKEIAESLFHAQVGLKKSLGEDVSNLKWGGEVELVSSLKQFKAAIQSPCASVVLFRTRSNAECKKISPFLDTLCTKYPVINFYKVDIEKTVAIAEAENVKVVPTVKIYRKGNRVKEMICPTPEFLESSMRHYSSI